MVLFCSEIDHVSQLGSLKEKVTTTFGDPEAF